MIRRAGILMCDEGDTLTAARHLVTLASDPDLRKELAERNRRLYESTFSWPSIAVKLEQVFASLPS